MVPVTGILRGDAPMIMTVFELIAMLAVLGIAFVLWANVGGSAAGDSAGS